MLIIQTADGPLMGSTIDGVTVFRGVPYAAAPIGDLRFKAPRPVVPWTDIRNAKAASPASLQTNRNNLQRVQEHIAQMDPGVTGLMAWPPYVGATYEQPLASEDCLYLDIWVPEKRPEAGSPVYVYYHGGANVVSSGSFVLERGENLARETGMIVVRPNNRLGALGWVHFGLLDDRFNEAINLGVQDQLAALRWVHHNIQAFGGDADNITIGGESAGATAVSHLLCMSESAGLYRRAILQSLTPFNPWCTQQLPDAKWVAQKYIELLGLTDIGELAHIDPERLLAVQNIMGRYFAADMAIAWRPLGAVAGGPLVEVTPAIRLSTEVLSAPPAEVMIGFAKDEWQFFRGHSKTVREGSREDVLTVLEQIFADKAGEVLECYERLHPGHPEGHCLSDIMSFVYFKYPSLAIADNLSKQGVRTYVYQFSFDLPGVDGELRAVHTGNIPFLFRNMTALDLACFPSFEGIDRDAMEQSSAHMGRHYSSFIASGAAEGDWREYQAEAPDILWFGEDVRTVSHLLSGEKLAVEQGGVSGVLALERLLVANLRQSRQTER
ncbi:MULTISPECIES: carboxylesterase/lipase family protein [unclassified Pseudomonas]|uniref:carboxylesterase/lipase family protein n=1 Tax=unclassified Pseudomonas TaxID=196821 RepID=UPI0015A2C172|nr:MULTISPECIES: carboxylesterase family protein [unclassified Pseudomonas]NWC93063.1 carboxylesterase/lipase family protein [Pseudomonas sp. IPO3779]NWD19481.1 carboxylesterase/lipase family protein [Pseudomonas sp. IPO3778]